MREKLLQSRIRILKKVDQRSLVNVDNRQFFLSKGGVFSLEEAGVLLQIHVGSEISLKIKPEFDNFDETRFSESICLHYEKRNQMWYFMPYTDEKYFSMYQTGSRYNRS